MVSAARLAIGTWSRCSFDGLCAAVERYSVFGKCIPFRDVSSGEEGGKRELGHGGEGSG
jgi:hypothetical protein